MTPCTVFVTTSGLGTRLEGLTQYTNKALVPIGDKYAICRIVERFPESTQFIVSLGYYGSHVRDFLELAYPTRHFTFIEVDPYEGPGSSQAYSMLCAEKYLTTPFLYHCCDTILPPDYDYTVTSSETSAVTVYVSPHPDYTTYSGITVRDETLVRFNRKREAIHDYAYIGIAYIANPALFWSSLRAAVENEAISSGSLGDTDAYRRMLDRGTSIGYKVVPKFYDTGNLDSYRHACNAFPGSAVVLAKPNESLCFLKEQGRVLKFLHSTSANAKRIARGHMLSSCGGPKILGERPNFMAMSYEPGTLLAECREWGIVRQLLDWAQAHLWKDARQSPEYSQVCRRFYRDKTVSRLASYKSKRPEDIRIVNGCNVGSVSELLDRIDWSQLCTDRFTHFHGDFILDNILMREDGTFVLLDWRECFDTEIEWGDPAYDLAKLRHNMVFNHSNIARGEFTVVREGDQVFVDLGCKFLLMRQLEELDAWIEKQGWSVGNIRILQALIWLNMAPLYEAPLCDFLYYFGKWNLWLALEGFAAAALAPGAAPTTAATILT